LARAFGRLLPQLEISRGGRRRGAAPAGGLARHPRVRRAVDGEIVPAYERLGFRVRDSKVYRLSELTAR